MQALHPVLHCVRRGVFKPEFNWLNTTLINPPPPCFRSRPMQEIMGLLEEDVLSEALALATERDLRYWEEHPEAGVILYSIKFTFAVLVYVKKEGLVWRLVDVVVTTTTIDPLEALMQAEIYIEETYDPVEYALVDVSVIGAWRVNPVYGIIEPFPSRYWFNWVDALSGYIKPFAEVEMVP